ncbi:MAG: trimeric intracellular cation channel family protein [Allosphingosinicella sp.]
MNLVTIVPAAIPPGIDPLLDYLDLVGLAVFALSGAVVAAAKRQTLVTFIFFAVITGVGGGTARDLLIGAPVFWIHENASLLICFVSALIVWLLPARIWKGRSLLWFDAVGLAAYAAYGAAKGLAFGVAPLPAVGMGVLTACLGGIIRDVLAGEPSILMRSELYVTAAALSAASMVLLALAGFSGFGAVLVAAAAGFALRAGAIVKGWSLPSYSR